VGPNVVELIIKPSKKLHGLILAFPLTNNRGYRAKGLMLTKTDKVRSKIIKLIPNNSEFRKIVSH